MTATVCQLCRPLQVPRRDHTQEECEDAVALDVPHGRFAIADGASESAQGGMWARQLVEAFVKETGESSGSEWIEPLQHRWADTVAMPDPATLPWFLEGRYRAGAFATFLGLTLDGFGWNALAVGDSCLFHIREGLLLSFPLTHSSHFDNTPWLVGSRVSPGLIPASVRQIRGEWQGGDRIFLMTDALARWFLSAIEKGGEPWQELEPLLQAPDTMFNDFVTRLRHDRLLKNDDTTLLAVCF